MELTYVFVQLGRAGDILSILPYAQHLLSAGYAVEWVVSREFERILDADARIEKIVLDVAVDDVAGAVDRWMRMERQMHPSGRPVAMLRTQVNQNPQMVEPQDTYQLEQWHRAGAVEMFHSLPLHINRTFTGAFVGEVEKFVRGGGQPLWQSDYVVINTSGHSAPYKHGDLFAELLKGTLDDIGVGYVDISQHRFSHPLALVPLLERARSLVTVDSLPLHVAYATHTPVYALLRDSWYASSEPRRNWIGSTRYHAGLEEFDAIARSAARMSPANKVRNEMRFCRQILHVVNDHEDLPERDRPRYDRAAATWGRCAGNDLEHYWHTVRHRTSSNNATQIGDRRKLPLVRDVFDFAVAHSNENDIVVFTNTDICLVPETGVVVRDAMVNHSCCWSARCDVNSPAPSSLSASEIEPIHSGADLFAFTPQWWRLYRDELPPMFLGAEGWDWVMKRKMRETNGRAIRCVCYHEHHRQAWVEELDSPSNRHNRKQMREFAEKMGINWRVELPHGDL